MLGHVGDDSKDGSQLGRPGTQKQDKRRMAMAGFVKPFIFQFGARPKDHSLSGPQCLKLFPFSHSVLCLSTHPIETGFWTRNCCVSCITTFRQLKELY